MDQQGRTRDKVSVIFIVCSGVKLLPKAMPNKENWHSSTTSDTVPENAPPCLPRIDKWVFGRGWWVYKMCGRQANEIEKLIFTLVIYRHYQNPLSSYLFGNTWRCSDELIYLHWQMEPSNLSKTMPETLLSDWYFLWTEYKRAEFKFANSIKSRSANLRINLLNECLPLTGRLVVFVVDHYNEEEYGPRLRLQLSR